jgi:hypothetical protein
MEEATAVWTLTKIKNSGDQEEDAEEHLGGKIAAMKVRRPGQR